MEDHREAAALSCPRCGHHKQNATEVAKAGSTAYVLVGGATELTPLLDAIGPLSEDATRGVRGRGMCAPRTRSRGAATAAVPPRAASTRARAVGPCRRRNGRRPRARARLDRLLRTRARSPAIAHARQAVADGGFLKRLRSQPPDAACLSWTTGSSIRRSARLRASGGSGRASDCRGCTCASASRSTVFGAVVGRALGIVVELGTLRLYVVANSSGAA